MRLTNANVQTNMLWSDLHICLTITLILSLSCLPTTWALSDKRLCADEKCEQIISLGSAKITYAAAEEGMLSFKIHTPVRIMSKGAGNNVNLWGVDINGRRGYANKNFIMEKKIFISEKELKHELPVVWPINQAAAAAPTTAAPQAADVAQQPVLNASETADDAVTTTTSPLDTLKLAILTEQDQASSGEATVMPITPVQPNLQLVDGTELPLEAVPAITERMPNHMQQPKADDTAELDDFVTTTTKSDEEYNDYDVDDEENSANEEEATLDSKVDEIPNNVDVVSQPNKAIKTESANVQLESPTDSSNVAASNLSQAEIVTETSAIINEAPLLNDTQNDQKAAQPLAAEMNAKEIEAMSLNEKTNLQNEAEKAQPVIEAHSKTSTKEVQQLANETEAQLVNQQHNKEVEAQTIQTVKIETQLVEAKLVSAQSVEADVKDQTVKAEIKDQTVEAEAKDQTVEVEIKNRLLEAENEDQSVEAENKDQLVAADIKDQATESKIKAQLTESENKVEKEAQLIEAQAKTQHEAPIIETQSVPVDIETQTNQNPLEVNQTEAEAEAVKNETNDSIAAASDVQQERKEAQQSLEVEPSAEFIEKVATPTVPHKDVEVASPTDAPTAEATVPASLPPLFKKQNFNDPNEFYKQLQQQQQQLANEAAQQQQQLGNEAAQHEQQLAHEAAQQENQLASDAAQQQQRDNQQQRGNHQHEQHQQQRDNTQHVPHEQPLPVQQTTPTPGSNNAYDALYEAEPTPAPTARDATEQIINAGTVEKIGLPSLSTAEPVKEDAGMGIGLFSTIMDTVNTFISKKPVAEPLKGNEELHRLLYPDAAAHEVKSQDEGYCTRTMDGNCPASITLDNFVDVLSTKLVDNSLLLLCVLIAAVSSLFFMFVYYCFCNSSKEGALLAKLNHLERSLLAAHKENLLVKHELITTRTKLSSIEDNSFGSNDMVAALRKQLETELYLKAKLQEQVNMLDKDLDNAAEAGLELNKMLSEVLNSQNGDEAFMNTVEELQQQLNDQEKIIIEINASLAEKSRENSELQYSFTESTTRLASELKSLQQDNYELEMEKAKLQTRVEEIQAESEQELTKALEARNYEMQRLQHQIMDLNAKFDKEHSELQTSLAKVEALEECIKAMKKDGNTNVQELITSAKTRGELNAALKKFRSLQTKLEQEVAAKARLENQLQISSTDVEQLKQDFNQSERDKLEAQTRLEVLSGYFREKETQLQKELSLQEAKWLQHQGENASTVETQTLMKNEIQTLKSQNDELRAEIEAQIASHKAQMGTLENRAHESWLAARQSERRSEEAQAEAAGLRRKLTVMASGGAVGDALLDALPTNGGIVVSELNPSPLPLQLPGSPGLLNMPNALPFLPAPFSPFMGLPPPFMPPTAAAGGARPPPLGRMRSPPPASSSRGGDRYSPHRDDRDDYSDYDEYDDDDEDERGMERRRRLSGSWGRAHRDSYMHSPRTYRSLSPSDSRYNYNDTETDFSPPPSPPPPHHRKGSSRPMNEV